MKDWKLDFYMLLFIKKVLWLQVTRCAGSDLKKIKTILSNHWKNPMKAMVPIIPSREAICSIMSDPGACW